MSWLSKDVEDLIKLKDKYCAEHECGKCDFNVSRNEPCLEEAVNTLAFTMDMIEKEKRRLSEYV